MSLTMRFSEADLGDVTIAATPDVTWEVLLSLHVLQDNHGPAPSLPHVATRRTS
jgi:hypothetical protein